MSDRDEFEKYVLEDGEERYMLEKDSDGSYRWSETNRDWHVWQAARASEGGEAVAAVNKASTGEYEFYPASGLVDMPNGIHKLYTHPSASETESFPDCDTCGKAMDYMPWHYSKGDERHLHACDECWPMVNPNAGAVPEVTPAMIEAGAQRLVSWEDNCTWPDSWGPMTVAAARQDAERVIRSVLSVMGGGDE